MSNLLATIATHHVAAILANIAVLIPFPRCLFFFTAFVRLVIRIFGNSSLATSWSGFTSATSCWLSFHSSYLDNDFLFFWWFILRELFRRLTLILVFIVLCSLLFLRGFNVLLGCRLLSLLGSLLSSWRDWFRCFVFFIWVLALWNHFTVLPWWLLLWLLLFNLIALAILLRFRLTGFEVFDIIAFSLSLSVACSVGIDN